MSGLIDSHVNRELDAFRVTVLQNVCSGCVVWLHLRAWTVAVGFQSCARWLSVEGSTGAPIATGLPFVKLNHT